MESNSAASSKTSRKRVVIIAGSLCLSASALFLFQNFGGDADPLEESSSHSKGKRVRSVKVSQEITEILRKEEAETQALALNDHWKVLPGVQALDPSAFSPEMGESVAKQAGHVFFRPNVASTSPGEGGKLVVFNSSEKRLGVFTGDFTLFFDESTDEGALESHISELEEKYNPLSVTLYLDTKIVKLKTQGVVTAEALSSFMSDLSGESFVTRVEPVIEVESEEVESE